MEDKMEFYGIISFFLILLSPALADFALNSSEEKKILSNKEEIRKWVRIWHRRTETTAAAINHSCNCPYANCDFVTFSGECMFGCCFEFTQDNHCRLCSIPIPDEDNDMDIPERNATEDSAECKRHFITIKYPEYTQKFQNLFNISSFRTERVIEETCDAESHVELMPMKTQ
ncbi:hypothetical protein FSP39_013973 [Pinctada imbricata]|uniref:Uncharacterized protein n=1 Tax=Pinctada imbricata TaxID=66713 RepID=A0AA89BI09_PINIB|nr:hypothetical protein FSP39_013973 [Pinctada imbricata]